MFAQLPDGFPKLLTVVREMGHLQVSSPPPIEDIGKRLRRIFARARPDGYRGLGAGEIRKLPYAYWMPEDDPLGDVEPQLAWRYWTEDLPQAVVTGPRRAKRWLAPLFFVYCERFQPGEQAFLEYAHYVREVLPKGEGPYAERLQTLQAQLHFFEPQEVAASLAWTLVTEGTSLDHALELHLLWPTFLGAALGAAAFGAALQLGPQQMRQPAIVRRILEWTRQLGVPIAKSKHRVAFADAMLMPWHGHQPPDHIKSALIELFMRSGEYGDPRLDGPRQYNWAGVSPQALGVMMNWLAGDTLRGFMKILEGTADEIWRYRQKFWMAYYNAGHVQEAWLALGANATLLAKRLLPNERGLGYGRLDGGAMQNQSVLLLKIGGLVFSEWSHNGSLRAYDESSPSAPTLYKRNYHGADLRAAESLDFHNGANQDPQLRHMNSSGGTWQRKARDFIRRNVGIHIWDSDIL